MNKKLLVGLALILLLFAGGWFFMNSKNKPSNELNLKIEGESKTSERTSSSLKDLISKGGSQTCKYSTEAGSGTVYVYGGQVRGDFEMDADGTKLSSHMIVKDSTSYIWTDGQTTGFKMKFDTSLVAEPTGDKGESSTETNGFDPNTNYQYSCTSWNADKSKFDLPKGVSFTEFNLPTTGLEPPPGQGTGTGTNPSNCSYCSALTGDDKAQCLKALNCN
jgi:predicted RNase H-related nuclease YkuK (DUF458 family)